MLGLIDISCNNKSIDFFKTAVGIQLLYNCGQGIRNWQGRAVHDNLQVNILDIDGCHPDKEQRILLAYEPVTMPQY